MGEHVSCPAPNQSQDWSTLGVLQRLGSLVGGVYRTLCASEIIKGRQRNLLAVAVFMTAIVVGECLLNPNLLHDRIRPLTPDYHAGLSLEMAVNKVLLGKTSVKVDAAPGQTLREVMTRDAEVLNVPLADLAGQLAGPGEEYGRKVTPFRNNENSLMLLDYAVLAVAPRAALQDLIRVHMVFKMGCLIVFTAFLLRVGISPFLAFVAFHLAVTIVLRVNATNPMSVYPFIMPSTLLLVGLLGFALDLGAYRRKVVELPVLVAIGVVAGFLFHLRSSYLPVGIAFVLLYALLAALARDRQVYRYRLLGCVAAALPVVCFLGGSKLFTQLWIQPIRVATAEVSSNYEYHAIAHPLVLGLALPPNDLAQREGIQWSDGVGLTLARRIDPGVQYLDDRYEKALFVYYTKLWLFHPDEMRAFYLNKLEISGTAIHRYARLPGPGRSRFLAVDGSSVAMTRGERLTKKWFGYLEGALDYLPLGGKKLFVLFAVLVFLPFVLRRWLHPGTVFALSALAAAGSLLLLENAIILPEFYVTYHGFLLFWVLFLGVMLFQAGLQIPCILRVVTVFLYHWVIGKTPDDSSAPQYQHAVRHEPSLLAGVPSRSAVVASSSGVYHESA